MYWKLSILFFFISTNVFTQKQEIQPVFQTGHYSRINQIVFHNNNQHLISAADDGRLVVWDILIGLQFQSIIVDQSGIKTFHFLNDTSFVTLSNNGKIQQWTFPLLEPIDQAIQPVENIQDITVINDSTIGLASNTIELFNLKSKNITALDYNSKAFFSSISYQKERNEIAVSGPIDNYCATISLDNPLQYKRYILGNINGVKYISKNSLLLTETSGSLVIVDLETDKKYVHHLNDNHNYITSIGEGKNEIALSNTYGFTQILSAEKRTLQTTIGLDGVALSALDYSTDDKWLATANNNGTIALYETENYKLNRILKGASAGVTDVQLYNDDLFVGYSDGIIRRINLPNNKIMSNSIKHVPFEEKSGISYSILSIDTLIDQQVELTVLKADRHHEKSNLLRSAKKYKTYWNLTNNEIRMEKEVEDIALRLQVDHNYRINNTYQLKHYLEEPYSYTVGEYRYVYKGDSLYFYQLNGHDTLIYPAEHEAPIEGLRFSQKHQLIISFSTDGSIRFWDTKGNYKAALYLSGQYGFTYWNPDNFYFSSKEMLEKIGYKYKGKLYSYEQFDLYYNRPNKVMENLPYFLKKDVADYKKAYHKRLEKLGLSESTLEISEDLPQLEVHYKGNYSTKEEEIGFTLHLQSKNNLITNYGYRINGVEYLNTLTQTKQEATVNIQIQLATGLNQIEFFGTDELGVNSLIKKVNITCEKNVSKPELYLVSIGLSNYANNQQNLVYASKDAKEITRLMQKNKQFKTIHETTLLNENFTKQKFVEVEEFLSNATINDVILFYYAGHGILDSELDYYLATYDMNFEQPQEKGLAFDDVEAFFETLTCRNKLIMVDACFSGELDKSSIGIDTISNDTENGDIQFRKGQLGLIDGGGEMGIFELAKMTFIDLNRNNSTNILSSASGIEYAMESDEWENGLFTYVLKDAILNEKADLNGDNLIRIMELQVYLRETVSILSNGRQNPILRKENSKNNFVIW